MTTGCPDCDLVQAKTGDDCALCLRCEDSYQEWIEKCARKRRKEIAKQIQELKSYILGESEVQNGH